MDGGHGAWIALRDGMAPYLPRLVGALGIVLAAWLGSRLVKMLVRRAATAAALDTRLRNPGLGALLADVAGALVWLIAVPALLGTLELRGLLEPFNVMLARLFGFVPNVLGAAIVGGVGLLIANVVRRIVTGTLAAAGVETLKTRFGLETALGDRSLAALGGHLVFALILLPTIGAAVQALGIETLARPVMQLIDAATALIPKLLSAAVLVVVGVLLGRVLSTLATTTLAAFGAADWPRRMGLREGWRAAGRDVPELGGLAVMVTVVLLSLAQAAQVLGFPVLTDAVTTLGAALARIAIAAVVLGAGLWLAEGAAQLARAAGGAHAVAWGRLARGAVVVLAVALALRQAGLPADIVALAFGALVVSIGLAAALAFGLGGRDAAARWIAEREARAAAARARHAQALGDAPPAPTADATTRDEARPHV